MIHHHKHFSYTNYIVHVWYIAYVRNSKLRDKSGILDLKMVHYINSYCRKLTFKVQTFQF